MLDWLSGTPVPMADIADRRDGKPPASAPTNVAHESAADLEETQIDPPDTPAPVFALRAFKQALFGTPAPPDRTRPPPKAQGQDAMGVRKDNGGSLSSPSKPAGILLTPGTGGTRRKTVSFGKHVLDEKDDKAQPNTVATPIVPGNFPTPWVSIEPLDGERGKRTKLTQSLFDVRDTPDPQKEAKSKATNSRVPKPNSGDAADITLDLSLPRSGSGKYWKQEYEAFSAKSTLEMRKLAKKEQVAKKYAKHKDTEASKLSEQLCQEQKKIKNLEIQVADYAAKLEAAMRDLQTDSNAFALSTKPSGARPDMNAVQNTLVETKNALTASERQSKNLTLENSTLQASLSRSETLRQKSEADAARLQRENDTLKRELKSQQSSFPESTRPKAAFSSDIWADLAADDGIGNSVREETNRRGLHGRSPLAQREANSERTRSQPAGSGGEVQKASNGSRTSSKDMSDERRERLEAAKRRLEMKKRSRELSVHDSMG